MLQGQVVLRDSEAAMDITVNLERQVQRVFQVILVQLEVRGQPDRLDHKEQLDQLDHKGRKEMLDPRDPTEQLERLGLLD